MTDEKTPQTLPNELISVCICTFKRAELLAQTLDGVIAQITYNQFSFEIIVIDNDRERSAEAVVRIYQENFLLKILYDFEPEQNISMARNRALRNASGNLIAFIDDDEVPVRSWLYHLLHTMKTFTADGVLGPVLPYYPEGAPQWLEKCNLFDRRRFQTGTKITATRDTRTGNVLLSRSILPEGVKCFDPDFGRTGGEDVDFFRKQIVEGRMFVWCDEAIAYETVPFERWGMRFYIKRYFRSGTINGEHLRKSKISGYISFIKSIISVPFWTFIFLFSLPLGKPIWFRPVLKVAYWGGCVLAFCGVSLLRDRE